MTHQRISGAEITRRGEALYERLIRPKLGPADDGKFVAVDIETGDYEVDVSDVAALKPARLKNPAALLYLLRVGAPAA